MNEVTRDTAWAEDKMNRKGVAAFLTNYLDGNEHIKVLNINSPWGSGKTFFLENWKLQLSEERVCVKFNAWECDYSGDAFISLAASIREQLFELTGGAATANQNIKSFTEAASKVIIAATPALAKGVLKKFTGIDAGTLSEHIDQSYISEAAEKAVESLISKNKETLESVKNFKSNLSELLSWASNHINDQEKKPTYIFIDELDRCRPTFAIELLERIKHFFDIENCIFIVATDTEQLRHSIKAIYGEGFAAERYIKRFFDAEFTLDNSDISLWVKTHSPEFNGIEKVDLGIMQKSFNGGNYYFHGEPIKPSETAILAGTLELSITQIILLSIAKTFNSKLRELEKIFKHIDAVSRNTSGQFHLFWAAYLCFLKSENSELYKMAIYENHNEALIKLNKEFPAPDLYLGDKNINVHSIFNTYISNFRSSKQEIQRNAQNLRKHLTNSCDTAITSGFSKDFDLLEKYPALVSLAHRID